MEIKYVSSVDGYTSLESQLENVKVVLDSNLCIYLENYFDNPRQTMNKWLSSSSVLQIELAHSFQRFLECINNNKYLMFDCSLAVYETCTDILTGESNSAKIFKRIDKMLILLEVVKGAELLKPQQSFARYLLPSVKLSSLEKLVSKERESKTVEKDWSLLLSYLYCLKIFHLYKSDLTNAERLIAFYDYMNFQIKIISVAHLNYAILLFGGIKTLNGKSYINLFHNVKKKGKKGFYNAAIDLNLVIKFQKKIYTNRK
ncbi:hypothetical protein [Listeria grayi]|uniref:Uncharacterized protein n=1 Tax=Listeria grayi FSL F6-1183 TaxID=1265827 RepID=A0A829R3L6_LISGR|nr:hypothetical protein [Listeria grayi]EUJ26622.1 hypothetical protein LMUR_12456 [Listeria grayi FSL F6-1183]